MCCKKTETKERERSAGYVAVPYCNIACIVDPFDESKFTDIFCTQLIILNEFQYKIIYNVHKYRIM